ncbi:cytochrome P450 [Gymnopilus junonius]|uniref:Cytochrome P450 n=1 Tax=Gymnopilus junonius TaxID=109634 RepID=A0A9P5TJZ9_GYMJU|nr:cytochrome P450 [Gymnopilus junonius]
MAHGEISVYNLAMYLVLASCFLAAWLIGKIVQTLITNRRHVRYPPGPKPKPIIGNMFDFPETKGYEAYVQWGKKYKSGFVYASALGNNILVVNKLEDADELFDRRAKMYSDRPVIPIMKLMGWDWNIAFLRYGKSWRLHRKLCQQIFRAEAARDYHPLLLKKVHEMLRRLLEDPSKFEEHSKMFSISLPMESMYGYEVKSFDDPCIVAADASILLAANLLAPGGTLINVFPALGRVPAWFPGATSRRTAEKIKTLGKEMQRIPLEFVKKRIEEGTATPSFVAGFFKKKEEVGASEEEEEAVRHIGSTIYSAASDTTISLTYSLFYLMAANPAIQRRAQTELDDVVGISRLPDFDDRPSLPYIEAIYRELLRFAPPTPLGMPHALTEDDVYKGYFIPKGTMVLGNIWAMTRDEELYEEPYKFNPERFLHENGELNDNKRIITYGFGRRVCVGKYVGSASIWIIIASTLACFNLEKCKDEFGNEIPINDDSDDFSGFFRHKAKFQCSFIPRSPMAAELIRKTSNN